MKTNQDLFEKIREYFDLTMQLTDITMLNLIEHRLGEIKDIDLYWESFHNITTKGLLLSPDDLRQLLFKNPADWEEEYRNIIPSCKLWLNEQGFDLQRFNMEKIESNSNQSALLIAMKVLFSNGKDGDLIDQFYSDCWKLVDSVSPFETLIEMPNIKIIEKEHAIQIVYFWLKKNQDLISSRVESQIKRRVENSFDEDGFMIDVLYTIQEIINGKMSDYLCQYNRSNDDLICDVIWAINPRDYINTSYKTSSMNCASSLDNQTDLPSYHIGDACLTIKRVNPLYFIYFKHPYELICTSTKPHESEIGMYLGSSHFEHYSKLIIESNDKGPEFLLNALNSETGGSIEQITARLKQEFYRPTNNSLQSSDSSFFSSHSRKNKESTSQLLEPVKKMKLN